MSSSHLDTLKIQRKDTFDHRSSENDRKLTASTTVPRPTLNELATLEFYKQENWFDLMCESLFKIKTRNTTIKSEIYCGVIHFISSMYCLAVIPQQLNAAGYGSRSTVVSVAATAGVGSIVCGLFANLPFVIAPPTVVSIFLSVFLQQHGDTRDMGDLAVTMSGVILVFFGWRPLFRFAAELIPMSIQVGTAIGIGLLTALAGSTEINLVVRGSYTILDIGKITPEVCISVAGVIIVCIAMIHHVRGAFCLSVIFCSLVWWIYDYAWPSAVFAAPYADKINSNDIHHTRLPLLTIDLIFLYILYLNGLVTSLSNLAHLTREDGTAPRARWIVIVSGVFTILAGLLSGPPVLISPESAASIKAGAKTGLSTVVCGVLFCLSVFLSPIFEAVPAAGTSPILIMIGVVLFQNVSRIDWRSVIEAAPAFVVLFYIPFTYSVIQGVALGYVVYVVIALFSGDLRENTLNLAGLYFPHYKSWLDTLKDPHFQSDKHKEEGGKDGLARDSDATDRSTRISINNGAHRTPSSECGLAMNITMAFETDAVLLGSDSAKRQRATTGAGGLFDTSNTTGDTMDEPKYHTSNCGQTLNDVENALHQSHLQSTSLESTTSTSSASTSGSGDTPKAALVGPQLELEDSGL